jgi:hypothetical protein
VDDKADPQAALAAATSSSTDPEVGLQAVAALRGLVETLQVDNARAKGWSWQDIAGRLEVSKPAVHQKHGPPQPVRPREATVMVRFTDAAGILPHFAREEAERQHQYYLGPSPVRLLVESHGLTLDQLRAAVLAELDRSEG